MSKELSQAKEMEERIDALEDELLKYPQVEGELNHLFVDGMYARTMLIPQGSLVTGKRHKRAHINIIVQGTAHVYTNEHEVEEVNAPAIFPSGEGVRKAVYAVDDVIWTTIHATKQTDVASAEDELVEKGRPHIVEALSQLQSKQLRGK
jgi:hypothetical protein